MQDFTGITFNYLTGVRATDKRKSGNTVWVWLCQCGNEIEVRSALVKNGHTKSCGCYKARNTEVIKPCRECGETSYRRDQNGYYSSLCEKCFNKQSSSTRSPRLYMLTQARTRAKKAGVPFSITEKDIVSPEYCPILGMKLEKGSIGGRNSSPSLDRIVPEKGYVPGNVAVISHQANRLKNNGTAEQHRRIADWMDAQKMGWNKDYKGLTEVHGTVWSNQGKVSCVSCDNPHMNFYHQNGTKQHPDSVRDWEAA